jgi:hypothetical protein
MVKKSARRTRRTHTPRIDADTLTETADLLRTLLCPALTASTTHLPPALGSYNASSGGCPGRMHDTFVIYRAAEHQACQRRVE